jgi:hypothetical protein
VVQITSAGDQLRYLGRAYNHRQMRSLLRVGQVLLHVPAFQHFDVQETQREDIDDYRVDRELSLL